MVDLDSIRTRKSIRTYTGEKLNEFQKKMILDYIGDDNNLTGLLGNKIRIEFMEVKGGMSGKIGTYGTIKNAPSFLIGVCRKDKDSLLDCGFVFEKLILFLESLDLGTCWLGGTFNREQLSLDMSLLKDEFIPVITPVGKGTDKFSIKENIIRKSIKADKRLDFDDIFFKNDFKSRIENEKAKEILQLVRFAPSASNKQPWRVVVDDRNTAHFYIERTQGYNKSKIGYDIQWLDIGIAISHYLIAKGGGSIVIDQPDIELLSKRTEYVASIK